MDFSTATFQPIANASWSMSLDDFINSNGGYATEQNIYIDIKLVSQTQRDNITTYNLIVVSNLVSSYELQLNFTESNDFSNFTQQNGISNFTEQNDTSNFKESNGVSNFTGIKIVQAFKPYGTNTAVGTIGLRGDIITMPY